MVWAVWDKTKCVLIQEPAHRASGSVLCKGVWGVWYE